MPWPLQPSPEAERLQLSLTSGPGQCAWYGERSGDRLIFGIADFWPSYWAAGGAPDADLRTPERRWIGLFDLTDRRFLEPIPIGDLETASGTWDVLPLEAGADRGIGAAVDPIAFTSLFEESGVVETASAITRGRVTALAPRRPGLSELAEGREGTFLASRYLPARAGSVVVFDASTLEVRAEFALPPIASRPNGADPGFLAAKTVAFDAGANAAWITTDRLEGDGRMWDPGGPEHAGEAHPTIVLSLETGEVLSIIDQQELQFVRFSREGEGVAVAFEDGSLFAIQLADARTGNPTDRLEAGQRTLLEKEYAGGLDFAQDITFGDRGEIVVTRWSGAIHVLAPPAPGSGAPPEIHRVNLPRYEAEGLYYSAVLHGGHVCATYCADVSVVCAPLR